MHILTVYCAINRFGQYAIEVGTYMKWFFWASRPKTLLLLTILALIITGFSSSISGEPATETTDDWNQNLPVNTPIPYWTPSIYYSPALPLMTKVSNKKLLYTEYTEQGTGPLKLLNLVGNRTTELVSEGNFYQHTTAFHQNKVIYGGTDHRYYLMDIDTGETELFLEEDQINDHGPYQYSKSQYVYSLALSNHYAVWKEHDQIRGKDLRTGRVFDISPSQPESGWGWNPYSVFDGPDLHEDTVAWVGRMSWDNADSAVFIKNLNTGAQTHLLETVGRVDRKTRIKLDGNKVLWQQEKRMDWEVHIFITDIETGATRKLHSFRKTTSSAATRYPQDFDMAGDLALYRATTHFLPASGTGYRVSNHTFLTNTTSMQKAALSTGISWPEWYTGGEAKVFGSAQQSGPLAIDKISDSEYIVAFWARAWVGYPSYVGPQTAYIMRLAPDYENSSKSASKEMVAQEDTFSYILHIENDGIVADENVVIKDTLPDGATYISATHSPQIEDKELTFNLGELAPGDSTDIVVNMTATGAIGTTLVNKAVIAPTSAFRKRLKTAGPIIVSPDELETDPVPDSTDGFIDNMQITIEKVATTLSEFNPYDTEQQVEILISLKQPIPPKLTLLRQKKGSSKLVPVRELLDIEPIGSNLYKAYWYGIINDRRLGIGKGALIAPDGTYHLALEAGPDRLTKQIQVKGVPAQ